MLGFSFAIASSLAVAANTTSPPAKLSAAEIVEKNVSARGGLEAWRAVQSMTMKGSMEAGGNRRSALPVPGQKIGSEIPPPRPLEEAQLPFVMELKRPRKMRLEVQFNGQTAIQVFDGANGWKLRPFLNRHEVEPYTPEELKSAALQSELDGPLVDCVKKGNKVEFEDMEKVEGDDTYRLKVTLSNGQTQHVWVDAKTFLEKKIEGTPRRMDGKYRAVATFVSDYRSVNGLMVPYTFETAVDGVNQVEKIHIEELVINPKLDDTLFAKLK
jgi:outer membrane lipoprotein-sorting protein